MDAFKLIAMDNIQCSNGYVQYDYNTNTQMPITRHGDTCMIDTLIVPISMDTSIHTLEVLADEKPLWLIPLSLIMNTSTVTKTKQHKHIIQLNTKLFSNCIPHHLVIPLIALQYSHLTVNLKCSNKEVIDIPYTIIYKYFCFDTDKRKSIAQTRHSIKINTYTEILLNDNSLSCTHTIPTSGIYVKTNHKLHELVIKYNGLVITQYSSIILDRHLIKKTIHWSNNHSSMLENTLKKLSVVKGVRGIISKYSVPVHYKEYFYNIPFNYDNDGNDSMPTTKNGTVILNMTINLTNNNSKPLSGSIYLKQHNSLLVTGGLCCTQL